MSQAGFRSVIGNVGSGPEMYIEDSGGASVAIGLNASATFVIAYDQSPTSTGSPGQVQIDSSGNIALIPGDNVSIAPGHLNVTGTGGYIVLPVSQPGTPSQGFIAFDGAGSTPAIHFAGTSNSGFGEGAANFDAITGSNNTAVGDQSLGSITTGNANCALGSLALRSLTSGISNVAIGSGSLSAVVANEGNVAIGTASGGAINTGNYNVLVGNGTASFATSCAETVAVGYAALQNLSTGTRNVAVGFEALNQCTESGSNTSVGYQALAEQVDGGVNTAVGSLALSSSVSGSGSTAIGCESLSREDGNGGNTCVGYHSGNSIVAGTFNTVVGWAALDNVLATGSGNGNVVIGASSLNDLSTGSDNIVIGTGSGLGYTSSESNNIIIGRGVSGSAGDGNKIRIGDPATQDGCAIAGVWEGNLLSGIYQPVVVSSNGGLSTLAAPTDGMVMIGDTGGSPNWATLTAGPNITITNAANSITITSGSGSAISNVFTSGATTVPIIGSVVSDSQLVTITAVISAHQDTYDNAYGANVILTAYRPAGGDVTLAGAPIINANNTSTVDLIAAVDTGTQVVTLNVVGVAAEDWNWQAVYQIQTI